MRKHHLITSITAVLAFACLNGKAAADEAFDLLPNPLTVEQAAPYTALNDCFTQTNGWIGSDSAYSIPLTPHRILWTFGDTWIGMIMDNKRMFPTMINNSAAIQTMNDAPGANRSFEKMTFHWNDKSKEPTSLWQTGEPDTYFWPGDGYRLGSKLFMVLHKITADRSQPPPFQFKTVSDVLMRVQNPHEPIESWATTFHNFNNKADEVQLGAACILHRGYLYMYSTYPKARAGTNAHPLILARIPVDALLNEGKTDPDLHTIQYLCHDSHERVQPLWRSDLEDPIILFPDAGNEMSVTAVGGIPGYVAVYIPPFSKQIMLRYSLSLEGPWSSPMKIYDCPETEKDVLVYSAKTHQELASKPGELVVTYCRNSSDDKSHLDNASLYFPKAIRVLIKPN